MCISNRTEIEFEYFELSKEFGKMYIDLQIYFRDIFIMDGGLSLIEHVFDNILNGSELEFFTDNMVCLLRVLIFNM